MGVFMSFWTKTRVDKFKNFLINLIKSVFGTALMALSINLFLLPNQLSTGGFSGIGTLLYYLLKIPAGTTVLVLNIPLFFLAYFRSGRKFVLNTILGTFFLSLFINLFENIPLATSSRFLGCIYGGILSGIGSTIVLNANSSTGGSDLLAQIIKTYKPNFKTGNIIVAIDAVIVLANTIFLGEIEIGLYSAIAIYILGKVLDVFFEGIDFAKMMIIISPKYKEISDTINAKVKRGTTAIYGKGMYKQDEKNLILCVASRREVGEIRKIINTIDKGSFLIITNAREVYGKGFKE